MKAPAQAAARRVEGGPITEPTAWIENAPEFRLRPLARLELA
jgi:hypothetical protein